MNLHAYSWIVCNSSGGKDSQTALRQTVLLADRHEFPRDRIVVSHQELGRSEWPGASELAREQAEHYGLRFEASRKRDRHGAEPSLLDGVRRRGKWPSAAQRYCTSDWKRGPGMRVLTRLSDERPGAILHIFGFRAEESPARAKKPEFQFNPRASTKGPLRKVYDWHPIIHWKLGHVWADIRASGVPYHPAYDLGMARLSCVFCVLASEADLTTAARHNPELFEEYLSLEAEIGHDFQHGRPLARIREKLLTSTT